MSWLICTDGSPSAARAIDYGATLARAAQAPVTLLGILPHASAETSVRAALGQAQAALSWQATEIVRSGKAANVILEEVAQGAYELVVMGSRGRRGWQRLAFGSVAARLARYSPLPVLIIKGEPAPVVRRVLVCTSGDVRGERVARWGGQVARWLNADSTILHVMSQIPISAESHLEDLDKTAEEAIARQTREGAHLERELALMRGHGAAAHMAPKIRYGWVLEEIMAEMKEGAYDLLVIGGHQAPDFTGQRNRLREYLLEDIADQIVMAVDRPILVVKGN